MMNKRFSSRQGFSLIELLVALTILAIALIPVAYFYSKSLQSVEQASIRTRALMLANERLAEMRQMPYDEIRTNITPSNAQKLALTEKLPKEGIGDNSMPENAGVLERSGVSNVMRPLIVEPGDLCSTRFVTSARSTATGIVLNSPSVHPFRRPR